MEDNTIKFSMKIFYLYKNCLLRLFPFRENRKSLCKHFSIQYKHFIYRGFSEPLLCAKALYDMSKKIECGRLQIFINKLSNLRPLFHWVTDETASLTCLWNRVISPNRIWINSVLTFLPLFNFFSYTSIFFKTWLTDLKKTRFRNSTFLFNYNSIVSMS